MSRRRRRRRIVEGGNQNNRFVIPAKQMSRLYPPTHTGLLGMGPAATVFRERVLKIDTQVQRNVVSSVPLLQSIINVRCDQLQPFTQRITPGQRRGFKIVPVDPDVDEKDVQEDIDKLCLYFEKTGLNTDPEREDDFGDFVRMLVREVFTIDQAAIELQYNMRGNPIAYWLVDGATIKRLNPESEEYKPEYEGYSYAQVIEDEVKALYTYDSMILDYQYKRADLVYRGYGYSPVEQCIDLITTLLFGHVFSRDQFIKNKIPQGFIAVQGDVTKTQLDAIQENWVTTMEGAGGQWAIPIVPSGKDGIGIDFKKLGQNNREMEYPKLMHFLVSLICAVFSIDPAELGIKSDDSNNLAEASLDTRQGTSRDRGLSAMLSFIQKMCNKILQRITEDFRFEFVGDDLDEEEKRAEVAKKRSESFTTIDEEREREGLEPFGESWSEVVVNPQVVQMINAEKAAEQQAALGEEQPGEDDAEYDEYDEEDGDEFYDDDDEEQGLEKSLRRFKALSLTL